MVFGFAFNSAGNACVEWKCRRCKAQIEVGVDGDGRYIYRCPICLQIWRPSTMGNAASFNSLDFE